MSNKSKKSNNENENNYNNNDNDNVTYYLNTNTSNYNPIYTNDITEISKPRRSNPDTISYISAIPLDTILNSSNSNEEDDDDDDEGNKNLALQNIISEIEYEIASLATVEKGSQFIEQIVISLDPKNNNDDIELLTKIISGFVGYITYLSTNRFASHVLQTLFDKITKFQNAQQKNNTINEYIITITKEIQPYTKELMIHVCGSHVLRSLLCMLGGVLLIKQRRKKMDTIEYTTNNANNDDNEECLDVFISHLLQIENLYEFTCHNSSGPFLNIVLQVLAYSEHKHDNNDTSDIISIKEDSKSYKFLQKILDNEYDKTYNIEYYSKDPVGSTILETIFTYKLPNNYFSNNILQKSIVPNITSLLQHNISNHIIQSILSSPSISKELLEQLFKQLETTTMHDEENINCLKYCIKNKNRRGVFHKLCLVCVKYQMYGDKLIHCIQSTFYNKNDDADNKDGKKKKKKKHKMSSIQSCIPKLLFLYDYSMDTNGARIIHALLKFYESYPKLVIDIIDGIINLSTKELDCVIKDGTISRCIIDGILEHEQKNSKEISSYIQKLYLKLKGKWIYYAIDRIGKHTVLKLYLLLQQQNHLSLVQELAEGYSRLQSSSIGKIVGKELGIDDFITLGEHNWKQKYLKKSSKKRFMEEMVDDGKKKKKRKKQELFDAINNDFDDDEKIKNDYDDDNKRGEDVADDHRAKKKKKKKKKHE